MHSGFGISKQFGLVGIRTECMLDSINNQCLGILGIDNTGIVELLELTFDGGLRDRHVVGANSYCHTVVQEIRQWVFLKTLHHDGLGLHIARRAAGEADVVLLQQRLGLCILGRTHTMTDALGAKRDSGLHALHAGSLTAVDGERKA